MAEILSIDQYPEIDWSKPYIHEDGNPAGSYGITEVTIGSADFKLNWKHQLELSQQEPAFIHSRIRFGFPGHTSFTMRSSEETPFSLEHPSRINESAKLVTHILTTQHQMEAADQIEQQVNKLIGILRNSVGFSTDKNVEEIGVLENLLRKYKHETAIESTLASGRRLQELQIPLFYETNSVHTKGGIVWTTPHLIEYYRMKLG